MIKFQNFFKSKLNENCFRNSQVNFQRSANIINNNNQKNPNPNSNDNGYWKLRGKQSKDGKNSGYAPSFFLLNGIVNDRSKVNH